MQTLLHFTRLSELHPQRWFFMTARMQEANTWSATEQRFVNTPTYSDLLYYHAFPWTAKICSTTCHQMLTLSVYRTFG